MGLVVQKYGGTSVGSLDRIKAVARKVGATRDAGKDVVVVVSAMAGDTDKLIGMAHEITPLPDEREMDLLLSSGERISSALMALALQALGYKAESMTGRQVGIVTDSSHARARIRMITGDRIRSALSEGRIAVVAGFQGVDEAQEVTTLGRGGSDTTAVALAAALRAEVCEIYTDVDGVYTTDPNIVPTARRLPRISYDEMLEMASLGAKVLQSRSVEFGKKYGVTIVVKSTFGGGEGTVVTGVDADMERVVVSGVAYDKNQAKVSIMQVPDRPGIAARIFSQVSAAGIVVDMIIQNISEHGLTGISFTVARTDSLQALKLVEKVAQEIGAAGVTIDDHIAKVSIVGVGMQSHSGVAARMFEAFARENINIMMISTSEIKISCVIDEEYTELAVRVLHDAFRLGEDPGGSSSIGA